MPMCMHLSLPVEDTIEIKDKIPLAQVVSSLPLLQSQALRRLSVGSVCVPTDWKVRGAVDNSTFKSQPCIILRCVERDNEAARCV